MAMGRTQSIPFFGSKDQKLDRQITPTLTRKTSVKSNNGFLMFLGAVLFLR